MTAPYQEYVVACRQDVSFALPARTVRLANVQHWARYRVVVVPLFGGEPATVSAYSQAEMEGAFADCEAGKIWDSGWRADTLEADKRDATMDLWFTDHMMTPPEISIDPVADFALDCGAFVTGVRIFTFAFFGSFDADPLHVDVTTPDPDGHTLSPISPGYYRTSGGDVFRASDVSPWGLPRADPGSVLLSTICSRVSKRGGLADADLDVTELDATDVDGYAIASQCVATDCLAPLLAAYFAYASEYDLKVNFKFCGEDSAITFSVADLLEGSDATDGAITKNLRNQETEFPRRIIGSYVNPAENYNNATATAERRSGDVIAIGDQAFQIPVVMGGLQAAQTVDKALKVAYARLEGSVEFSVPFGRSATYLKLCCGEPATFLGKRWVAQECTLSDGYLKFKLAYDRKSAYTSVALAQPGSTPAVPPTRFSGVTVLIAMNLPALRSSDGNGLYLAAGPLAAAANWVGCSIQISYDGQATWSNVGTITDRSTMGTFTADETSHGVLSVQVDGPLETVTDAQIAAQANGFAILASNHPEIGQFQTATQTGADTYDLSDVGRGLLGTTYAPVTQGQRIVMLDSVTFLPIDLAYAGKVVYLRAIGFGETVEDGQTYAVLYDPDTTVIHDGGTVTT